MKARFNQLLLRLKKKKNEIKEQWKQFGESVCVQQRECVIKLHKSLVQQVLSELRLFPRSPGLEEMCPGHLSTRLKLFLLAWR